MKVGIKGLLKKIILKLTTKINRYILKGEKNEKKGICEKNC